MESFALMLDDLILATVDEFDHDLCFWKRIIWLYYFYLLL